MSETTLDTGRTTPHDALGSDREPAWTHPEIAAWAKNVGEAVSLDLAQPLASPPTGLTLLSWNLAIGTARLGELIDRLQAGEFGGLARRNDWPLVILAQEAYRADDTVPERCTGRWHGGRLRNMRRSDIVSLARSRGLSLRYTPSMRNGLARSDRGNAILATIPVTRAYDLLLPYVRQRRVAVAVELYGVPDVTLVSAHLDTGGRLREEAKRGRIGGGRVAQAASLARALAAIAADRAVVIGADLNTPLGVRDPAVVALVRAGLRPATRCGGWWHTFHGPLRLLLDHVLFRSPNERIASVQLHRLDELPGDGSRRVFGSDHHPLLAHVAFQDTDRP